MGKPTLVDPVPFAAFTSVKFSHATTSFLLEDKYETRFGYRTRISYLDIVTIRTPLMSTFLIRLFSSSMASDCYLTIVLIYSAA